MEKSVPSSAGHIDSVKTEKNTDNDITAICNNCNKRFKSTITMHLKMTGARHHVNFINHGNYDKNRGMMGMKRQIKIEFLTMGHDSIFLRLECQSPNRDEIARLATSLDGPNIKK